MFAYHCSGSLIEINIEMLIELFYVLFLQPFLCVGELTNGAFNVELSSSKVSSGNGVSRRVSVAGV